MPMTATAPPTATASVRVFMSIVVTPTECTRSIVVIVMMALVLVTDVVVLTVA